MPGLGLSNARAIDHGGRFQVARGRFGADRTPAVAKRALIPAAAEALRHEYALLRRAEGPGVSKALALVEEDGHPLLVLEDAGPEDLAAVIARGPLSVETFLHIAVRLAEALMRVHAASIVHRDVCPENVVMRAPHEPTLVDFDLATDVVTVVSPSSPDRLEGTLATISPEQTGRLNRVVDARSDLYSLGATLYAMLTGAVPFSEPTPARTVQAHLTRVPASASTVNPEVPEVLSAIVDRLLAKLPEHRYQSAGALAEDLRTARTRWYAHRSIEPFELGSLDRASVLALPERLYGRDAELEALCDALRRVRAGARELVTIVGQPGMGKSRLLDAFAEQVGGPVLRGQFGAPGDAPYGALRAAFGARLEAIAHEPPELSSPRKQRIALELGPNAAVLAEILPPLTGILGPTPPVAPARPAESAQRFLHTFVGLARAVAEPESPLILLIDDAQWADSASLEVLRAIATDATASHVLLVVACRPGPLLIEPALDAQARVSRLSLSPLSRDAVTSYVADTLGADPERARPLAELVHRHSAGVPLLVRSVLSSFHAQSLLVHDALRGKWDWDLGRVAALPLPARAVDVLVGAIERLPPTTRDALAVAASVGRSFELGVVAAIEGEPVDESARRLWDAVCAGVLLPLTDPRARTPAYRFAHDRVQQAAYELTPESERSAIHLRAGRALRAAAGGDDEALFAIVDQLERGVAAMESECERLELAALELRAGRRARASVAYGPALAHLERGIALLPEGAFDAHHELAFDLYRDAVECCYVTGARERLDALGARAEGERLSHLERADLTTLRVTALTQDGRFEEAIARGREGLRELGVSLPAHIEGPALGAEIARIDAQIRARGRDAILDAPRTDDPLVRAKCALLSETATALYFVDPDLSMLADTAVLPITLERGLTADTATALVAVARHLGAMEGDHARASELASLALEVARRAGDRGREAEVCANVGIFIQPWHAPLRSSVPLLRRAFELGVASGSMTFAAYARTYEAMVRFCASEPLSTCALEAEAAYELAKRMGNPIAEGAALMLRQATRCLRGLTVAPFTLDDADYDDAAFAPLADQSPITAHYRHRLLLEIGVTAGDFEAARRHADACAEYARFVRGMFASAVARFFGAIARAASLQGDALAELREDHAALASWARGCPESFACMERTIAAEIARIEERTAEAFDLYDQAIELAVDERSLRLEALVCERAAAYREARGRDRAAALHRMAARDAYARWGAIAKVRQIEATLPASTSSAPRRAASPRGVSELELSRVQRAVDAIVSALDWEPLLDRVLSATRDVAGATRTALVLAEDGELMVRGVLEEGALRATGSHTRLASAPIAASVVEEAMRTGEAALRIDPRESAPRDTYLASHDVRSVLAVPVQRQAVVTGALYLEHRVSPRAFEAEQVAVVALLASHVAVALENGVLFGKLRREIEERRRTEGRVRFLADASMVLAESLEVPATLRRVARLSVERIADFCAIDLRDGELVRRVAEASSRGVEPSLVDGAPVFEPAAGSPASRQARGRAVLVPALSSEDLAILSTDPAHLVRLRELGLRSLVSVPIVARGAMLGAISIAATRRRPPYGAGELRLMGEVAARAALALENARLYRDAREAVRVRDEFLSVASHELRGPVSALTLTLQGITSGLLPQLPEAASRPLAIAERQTRRLARLVDELLDVARLRAEKLFLKLEPISLADVVNDIAERFEGELAKAGCTLEVSVPKGVVGLWDPTRLGQVIENLLSNALKFGRGAPIEIRGEVRRGVARLAISDHGVGIPSERIPFIFDRFERAVSPEHFGGLGLGLYIVRELVGALGGRVEVESVEGEGATFTVELPLRGPRPAHDEHAPRRSA